MGKNFKNHFDMEAEYPARLTAVSTEKTAENDYNVTFKFLVFNGSIFKEFTYRCINIMTTGRFDFKSTCGLLTEIYTYNLKRNFSEEETKAIERVRRNFDLNSKIGTFVFVNVLDSPKYALLAVENFSPITDEVYSENKEYLSDLGIEKSLDETFPNIFSTEKIPDEINDFAKSIIFDLSINPPKTRLIELYD